MLPASRFALLGPFATCSEQSRTIGIVKTALLALVQFFIVLLNDFDHKFIILIFCWPRKRIPGTVIQHSHILENVGMFIGVVLSVMSLLVANGEEKGAGRSFSLNTPHVWRIGN